MPNDTLSPFAFPAIKPSKVIAGINGDQDLCPPSAALRLKNVPGLRGLLGIAAGLGERMAADGRAVPVAPLGDPKIHTRQTGCAVT